MSLGVWEGCDWVDDGGQRCVAFSFFAVVCVDLASEIPRRCNFNVLSPFKEHVL